MTDPSHSVAEEIRHWAFDAKAPEPTQDFDLMLLNVGHPEMYLELAADPECPKANYFLGILYLTVGDAVSTGYQTASREVVADLIAKGAAHPAFQLNTWAKRSRELMENPHLFDYEAWCGGGLAALE